MPFYHKLGNIPHKRHTVLRNQMEVITMKSYSGQSVLMECPLCYTIAIDQHR